MKTNPSSRRAKPELPASTRQPGHYWVRYGETEEPAEWDGRGWWCIRMPRPMTDDEFDEIGERIEREPPPVALEWPKKAYRIKMIRLSHARAEIVAHGNDIEDAKKAALQMAKNNLFAFEDETEAVTIHQATLIESKPGT